MTNYCFKITLEVKERDNSRVINSQMCFDSQQQMADNLGCELRRAANAACNCPPTDQDFLYGFAQTEEVKAIAEILRMWTAESDLNNCLQISVNIGQLIAGSDYPEGKVSRFVERLKRLGVNVNNEPKPSLSPPSE